MSVTTSAADERPKLWVQPRQHVQSLAALRSVRAAVTRTSLQRDLLRFILLVPLRRATRPRGCCWSEVDLDQGRIRISAERMKARPSA